MTTSWRQRWSGMREALGPVSSTIQPQQWRQWWGNLRNMRGRQLLALPSEKDNIIVCVPVGEVLSEKLAFIIKKRKMKRIVTHSEWLIMTNMERTAYCWWGPGNIPFRIRNKCSDYAQLCSSLASRKRPDKEEASSLTMCANNRFVGVENKTPRGKLLTFTRNYGKINFILLINTKKYFFFKKKIPLSFF